MVLGVEQLVVSEASGNREKAAELLGIDRKTLYRKLRQYSIE
jgi:DNA-binding protein Fis